MVTYSEWFDPPDDILDLPVRFDRALMTGTENALRNSVGVPVMRATTSSPIYTYHDTDVESVPEQWFLEQASYYFYEPESEWRVADAFTMWQLAVCYRWDPQGPTLYQEPPGRPEGATGFQLEDDTTGGMQYEWRVEGELEWRTPAEFIAHRASVSKPEAVIFGAPYLRDGVLHLGQFVPDGGSPQPPVPVWGSGPEVKRLQYGIDMENVAVPFSYVLKDPSTLEPVQVMPIATIIGPHLDDAFDFHQGSTSVNFNYLCRVNDLRFYVKVQHKSRYRWIFGEQGAWNLRQRQTLPGSDSWPLRQRQNGSHSGSWPLRQRQIGI